MTNLSIAENINGIIVNGNKRITSETIFTLGELNLTNFYDDNKINETLKLLFETEFFEDIKINISDNKLIISVIENPIIEDIEIKGIKNKNFLDKIYNDISYGGSGDPSAYVPFILLTKYQNGGRSSAVVSPTKEAKLMSIDTTRPESSLRKEKRGATVIVAQPPAQQEQASRPVGGSPPSFSVSDDDGDMLNSMMIGKLLLDLAY